MKNAITLENISKAYGELCVLDGFSLGISESVALMGASGKGKTTLARIIMGLERADSGRVSFTLPPRISAVFQEDRLFDSFSAVDNICAAIGRAKPKKEAKALASELLAELCIDRSEHMKAVGDYSGGMRRRVAIARALAVESDILILDEPYKGLDESTREKVACVIRARTRDKLVILITHDKCEAHLTGIDRIVMIE